MESARDAGQGGEQFAKHKVIAVIGTHSRAVLQMCGKLYGKFIAPEGTLSPAFCSKEQGFVQIDAGVKLGHISPEQAVEFAEKIINCELPDRDEDASSHLLAFVGVKNTRNHTHQRTWQIEAENANTARRLNALPYITRK